MAKYFSAHLSNLHSLVSAVGVVVVGGGGGGWGGTQSVIRACLVLAHGDGISFEALHPLNSKQGLRDLPVSCGL